MTEYTYQNDYYYTTNTGLDVNGTLVGTGASIVEAFLDDFLDKSKGSHVTKSLKFLTKYGILSSVVSTTVEVVFNGEEVKIGETVINLGAEFALEAFITASLLAAGVAPSLGFVLGVSAGSSLIMSGADAVWEEFNLEIDSFYADLFNGSLVDLKFTNSSGEHSSGIMLPSATYNVLGVKGSIIAYLDNTTESINNGDYLTFTDGRDGDQIGGEIYKLFNASAFQAVADKLGISLGEFLNLGTGGKTNNDIFYSGFNKIAFTENTIDPSQSSKIYVQVGSQVVAVDAIYNGSENGNNLLAGRTNAIIYGTTQITYPDALIVGGSEYGASMIIKSGRSAGDLEGNHILIGSDSADSISFDAFATAIDGQDGVDTIDYSSLNFLNQAVDVDLAKGTATNGIALNSFQQSLYNIENVIGSNGNDSITGNSSNNTLSGGEGNDTLSGKSGNDTIYGDSGDDNISGDEGNDFLTGGSGNDNISGGSGVDTLMGNSGNDTLSGGEGNDFLYGHDGFDTYNFSGNFGIDLISDSDKSGRVIINGREISGTINYVKSVGDNNDIYRVAFGDRSYDLIKKGADLLIKESGNTSYDNLVIVKNFTNGSLGISLNPLDPDNNEESSNEITDPKQLLPNFKDYFEDLIDQAVSSTDDISSAFQSSLNLLLQSQSPTPPRWVDPLTLDLDGDGVELINVANSNAFFDLDVVANLDANGNFNGTYTSDGQKEQVGWVKGDDGLLTLDKNNNGVIDNILELFGKSNKTGTQELREYDLNNDGKIDASDTIFSQLKLWQDSNGNGTSESGELKSLSDYGITSINVAPESLTAVNANSNGNLIISEGTYTQNSQTKTYANLNLAVNQSNSVSYTYTDPDGNIVGDYTLNLDVLSLPMMRGYGNVEALPIAASKNEALLNALKDLNSTKDLSTVNTKIETILFNWAGTQDVIGMRGAFDARKLATLEEMRGEAYVFNQTSGDVAQDRLGLVEAAWMTFFNDVKIKLLVQSVFRDIFSYEVVTEIPESVEVVTRSEIDPVTGEEITVTKEVVIPASTSVETFSASYDFATDSLDLKGVNVDQVFANIEAKLNSITNNDSDALDATVAQQINNTYAAVEKGNFVNQLQLVLDLMLGKIVGMNRDVFNEKITNIRDTYLSNISTDFEFGASVGYAGGNNSENPNGIFAGNKGSDILLGGGAGDDIYVFNKGDGKDIIDESGRRGYFYNESEFLVENGNDTILMGKGITKDDVYVSGSAGQFLIKFKSTDADQITIDFSNLPVNRIEKILFSNGDAIDLTDPNLKFSFFGSDNSEVIAGSSDSDILSGGKGNDILQGSRSDDTYVYKRGDGLDLIAEYGQLRNETNYGAFTSVTNKFRTGSIEYGTSSGISDTTLDFGNDTIQFEAGITEEDLSYFINGFDLHIQIAGSPDDLIIIKHQFYGTVNRVENLKFTLPLVDENGNPLLDANGKALTEEKIVSLKDKDWSVLAMRTEGTSGNDNITAGAWTYGDSVAINAGDGDDTINVTGFKVATLNGEGGNDIINGSVGDDLITGGTGNDTLSGGEGADTYFFNLGDGRDVIFDSFSWEGAGNRISFGAGIAAADIVISRSAVQEYNNRYDVVISFKNSPNDQITVKNYLGGGGNIKFLEFLVADENGNFSKNVVEFASLMTGFTYNGTDGNDYVSRDYYSWDGNDVISTGAGNDYVLAEGGDDKITGGTGNDYLSGSSGNDTYYFNKGDGLDSVVELGQLNNYFWWDSFWRNLDNGVDTIQFGEGISKDDLIFSSPDSYSMVISFKNSPDDKITISNQLIGTSNRIETLKFFDGSTIDLTDTNSVTFYANGSEVDDSVSGTKFKDAIDLGEGNNFASSFEGDDIITSGSGADNINSGLGNDVINSGAGNDVITSEDGDDVINAGDGDDNIMSGNGDDVINAGKGNDVIGQRFYNYNGWSGYIPDSNLGNDTYIFNVGDGSDKIIEDNGNNNRDNGGLDKIQFGEGILAADVYFVKDGSDLLIKFKNSETDQIRIYIYFATSGAKIETLQFADGSSANIADILKFTFDGTDEDSNFSASEYSDTINAKGGSDIIYALGGDDIIDAGADSDVVYAGSGNDIITGGTGSDTLMGEAGDDTYVYNIGDGEDRFYDTNDANQTSYGSDKIKFGAGITRENISLSASGGTLQITVAGNTGDKITIYNQYYYASCKIETIEFADGSTLDISDATTLEFEYVGDANNNTIYASEYRDKINAGDGNDTIYARGGNDIINAGKGDDVIEGGLGDDTYIYNKNDGQDVITESYAGYETGRNNKIVFGADIAKSDVLLSRVNGDLVIKFSGNAGDQITIPYHFYYEANKMQTLEFADGSKIDLKDSSALTFYYSGTDGSETISGFESNDIIYGNGGNDTLYGNGGNDAIYGGDGADTIDASEGNDIVVGGKGDDNISGQLAGNDTYIFSKGDGSDTIMESINYNGLDYGYDKIKFDESITKENVIFSTNGSDLYIKFIDSPNDQITIRGQFGPISNRIELVEFADGSSINISSPSSIAFRYDGTAGNDTIFASSYNDIINGGDGNDTIDGYNGDDIITGGKGDDRLGTDYNFGNDTYIFNVGDGKDSISEAPQTIYNYSIDAGSDTIKFGADIVKTDIRFSISGNNVVINFRNSVSDQITIKNFLRSIGDKVEKIEFADGTSFDISGLNSSNLDVYNYDYDHFQIPGNNYDYNLNAGELLISDASAGVDVINFGADVAQDQIHFVKNGNDLVIKFGVSNLDKITIQNQFGSGAKIETLKFSDGSTLNISNPNSLKLDIFGTDGADVINATSENDYVSAGLGDDSIYDAGGSDTYIFNSGDGKDSIYESSGALDKILFGAGISASDVYLSRSQSYYDTDLYINFRSNSTDQIIVKNYFSSESNKVENLQFADGLIVGIADLKLEFNGTENDDYIRTHGYNSNQDSLVHAGAGNDNIDAGSGNDILYGEDGDDSISTGNGNDIAYGGAGNDFISSQDGVSQLYGGEGNDTIYAGMWSSGSYNNFADGGAGNDYLGGGNGNDTLIGGDGDDQIYSRAGNDIIDAGNGNDQIYSEDGDDVINAGAGIDDIHGGEGDDMINAGAGNDFIFGDAGNNILTGGEGSDRFMVQDGVASVDLIKDFDLSAVGDKIDLSYLPTARFFSDLNISQDGANAVIEIGSTKIILENIDSTQLSRDNFKGLLKEGGYSVSGSKFEDKFDSISYYGLTEGNALWQDSLKIYGKEGNDEIRNWGGNNDLLDGGAGDDKLFIERGNNTLTGGSGADKFIFSYVDSWESGVRSNVITDFDANNFNEKIVLNGVGGVNSFADLSIVDGSNGAVVSYTAADNYGNSVTNSITLNGVNASQLSANNFDIRNAISGTAGDDVITTDNAGHYFYGNGGNDLITTGAGEDHIFASDGNDVISTGAGNDFISSGLGADNINAGSGDDIIKLSNNIAGNSVIHGGSGNDQINVWDGTSANYNEIFGEDGDDKINLYGESVYQVSAGEGDDAVVVWAKFSTISGDAGNDSITLAAASNNEVLGGIGDDLITIDSASYANNISGGVGGDIFTVRDFSGGKYSNTNTIADFEISNLAEKIDLQFLNFASFEDLQISQNGLDSVIALGVDGGKLILKNIDSSQLTAQNFIFKNNGTAGNDSINASNKLNVVNASEGDDVISISGLENYISGGLGNDIFVIEKTANSITEIKDFEVANLNEKIQIKGFDAVREFADLSLEYRAIYDNLGNLTGKYDVLTKLGDGQVLTILNVEKNSLTAANFEFRQNNTAPVAEKTTATTNEDNSVIIDVLSGASDVDVGNILVISSITNGAHGTASIVLDASGKQVISYIPNSNYNGTDQITYTISDGNGGFVTKDLAVTVNAVNDAPIVGVAIATQAAKFNNNFTYVIPETAFTDVDNSSLTYSAKLSNGSALPSWLIFDAASKTFTGTPPSGSATTLSIQITASDGALFATQIFKLNLVTNVISGTSKDNSLDGTSSNDEIYALGGDDLIAGSLGADIINGGDGKDTVSYDASSEAVIVNLTTNVHVGDEAVGDILANIENITGSSYNDILTGNSGKNTIRGGNGNDIIIGGLGADTIKGGDGSDTASYIDSEEGVTINLETNVNKGGSAAGDTLFKIENIIGSEFNDNITGNDKNNILSGEAGNDRLKGAEGSDQLIGGAGADILTGGRGKDIFIFNNLSDSTINSSDLITDFTRGQDRIDFSALNFTGISSNIGQVDESILTYHFEGNNTVIEDHDHTFQVKLTGTINLSVSDFDF